MFCTAHPIMYVFRCDNGIVMPSVYSLHLVFTSVVVSRADHTVKCNEINSMCDKNILFSHLTYRNNDT